MTTSLFREDLTDQEVMEYRDWAIDNYVINSQISPLWHPVLQDECYLMNERAMGLKDSI